MSSNMASLQGQAEEMLVWLKAERDSLHKEWTEYCNTISLRDEVAQRISALDSEVEHWTWAIESCKARLTHTPESEQGERR